MIEDKLINQAILYLNNFLIFIVLSQNKKYITIKKITNYYLYAMIILAGSVFLKLQGLSIPDLFYTGVKGVYSGGTHINLLGMNMRFAGFADDPNYATLFSLIGIILFVNFRKINSRSFNIVAIIVCLFIYILSFSKTMTIGFLIILIVYSIIKILNFNPISRKIIYAIIILICFCMPFIVIKLDLFENLTTISTRYDMWHVAEQMFYQHPILGNGLTSFRCVYNQIYNGTWYVQTHSTYFQLLSEQGLIGFILFLNFILHVNMKTSFAIVMMLLLLFFSVNFESIYLQIFIFLTYIPAILVENK